MKNKFTTIIVILTTLILFVFRDNTSSIESTKSIVTDNSHKGATNKAISSSLKKSDKHKQEPPALTEKQKAVYSELKNSYKKQLELANEKGIKTDYYDKSGRRYTFVYFDENGTPRYYSTCNKNAAISAGTDQLWQDYELYGSGMTIGVWDEGNVRDSHSALKSGPGDAPSRVYNKDSSFFSNHSTHVTGTLVAVAFAMDHSQPTLSDITSSQGMAKRAEATAYDWSSDTYEMRLEAATINYLSSKINISNHSYGINCGWERIDDSTATDGFRYAWFGASSADQDDEDSEFGSYQNSKSIGFDSVAYDFPYLLSFCAAGNDRDDNFHEKISLLPTPQYYLGYDKTSPRAFDEATAPPPDDNKGGYDTIIPHATAKNVMTVGAIKDAVTNQNLDLTKENIISDFSSWGPCNDGRIKPDVVTNGVYLLSTIATLTTEGAYQYDYYSGTSMASPSAAGSALLLQEFYHRKSTHTMRAATLKGLILHTAYDLGRPGPDYCYGWGLMDSLKAVQTIDSFYTTNSNTTVQEISLSDKENSSLIVIPKGNSNITATICWTDPAGPHPTEDKALVNDLDMRISQGGTIHKPWVMGGLSEPTANANNSYDENDPNYEGGNKVDPVEQVVVPMPFSNDEQLTLTVTHKDTLQSGSQNYSLIVTGIKTLFVTGNDKYIVTNNQSVTESDNTDFGNVRPDQSKLNVFKIVNYSATPLTIAGIDFSDEINFSTPESFPITVPATGDVEIYIEFSPKSENDSLNCSATINFEEVDSYTINVSGSASIYTAVDENENTTTATLTPEEKFLLGWGDGEINSAGNFMGSVNFTVYPGWNMLSMPFINSDSYLTKLNAKEMTAWSWDEIGQSYKIAKNVGALTGLWVYSPHESAVVLTMHGEVESSHEINIKVGWNLTGFSIGTKLSDLPEKLTYFSWIAGKYRPTSEIDSTNGYWVFSEEPVKITLEIPIATSH